MSAWLPVWSPARTPPQNWDSLVDRFFDEADFRFNPSAGTSAGFHQYDARLEDYSRSAIEQQVAVLRQYEREVQDFPASNLNQEQAADRELVLGTIRSSLLDLESIRTWETNPDHYSSAATNAVFVIMSRKFAPPEERLKSVIARERQMPKMFADARANLKNPPRIYTEVAIEQLPGIVSFFEKDVPLAFNAVKDRALLDQFHQANAAVIRELQSYQTFLKNDLLPRSKGDFRIGAENYRKKLLYDEMVDIPLDRLLQIGYDEPPAEPAVLPGHRKEDRPLEDSATDSGRG